ncbi:MAG: type II toxin-antitoxin system PemK/MazF family toxin [Candidatus Dependentiae bacterium]|nr:type II toxin-antitoxin system PemK/MazF family toxin [Candidatus Dependentiae bacterium]
MTFPKRGDVYWVNLDPSISSEINKTRPALIVSNNAGNEMSQRVIIAPITSSKGMIYPFEVKVEINTKQGKILLDQVRSIDKERVNKKITTLELDTMLLVDKALKTALAIP